MIYPRSHHGFVSHLGKLWAVAGSDGKAPMNTTESFDPITKVWEKGYSLREARSCCMTVSHRGEIWVLGGRNGTGRLLRSVEMFDRSKKWTSGPNLPQAIMLGSAISMFGTLFVVGGMTGDITNPIPLDTIYILH